MAHTLVRQHQHTPSLPAPVPAEPPARARDWAEIQERMLVPLYEAVYDRLGIGPGTRLLGLDCGAGLALLLAAARGAEVSGAERDAARLALARERLTAESAAVRSAGCAPEPPAAAEPYTMITAFTPPAARDLAEAAALAGRGSPVVLADWGPAERCASAGALRVAARLADPTAAAGCWRPSGRDDLDDLVRSAGLRPDGSGRVACPFGYADTASAVRGLLSTGYFDAAMTATDEAQVLKELTEAIHPYRRTDGTVWMPNVFRYVVARTR
ncbi:SAM-dependent methyltransferase [Streptomyces sp. A7024]|uniref:SAM-dependent methyltransferase n=1 Tax=Streptomyces coryli TaxID=1128680 RepID=A0A6G4U7M5_9ACTN|nr:SAM-dependent methyltransferase [Streptomyces coryli]NGN68184.1 SAM-dependent methyltransferase [Streptomyces coryli]